MRLVVPYVRTALLRLGAPAPTVPEGDGPDVGWYVVGYRADGAGVVLGQCKSAARAQRMAAALSQCEGYVRVVAEEARGETAWERSVRERRRAGHS